MRLTENKIAVEEIKQETSIGGIYLPEMGSNVGGVKVGTVVAVGPGKYNPQKGERVPCCVKPGDIIMFNTSTGACISVALRDKMPDGKPSLTKKEYFVMPDYEAIFALDDNETV